MKYGIIVCRQTRNIGDDIQSYAAARLLPQVDYYIEREHLDVFRPLEPEPVNVIMNGWFMNNKLGWPISPCINPLYVSMHFQIQDDLDIGGSFLDGLGSEDLIQHQPIGCRDLQTKSLLEGKGISAWFSGCMTMTLDPIFPKSKERYVCLTNVPEVIEDYVRRLYPDLKVRIIDQGEEGMVDQRATWEERFKKVERILGIYQNAEAVITTRLHCALPCLALGTPVLLLSDKSIREPERFDGLKELLHSATVDEFMNGSVLFDLQSPPTNPKAFQSMREELKRRVGEFVAQYQECTPELRVRYATYDSEWERRALWKNGQIMNLNKLAVTRWVKMQAIFEEMNQARLWLQEHYQYAEAELQKQKEAYQEIERGKAWLEEHSRLVEIELQKQKEAYREIECGKTWLEEHSRLVEIELQRQQEACQEIERGKTWLEEHSRLVEMELQKKTQDCQEIEQSKISLEEHMRLVETELYEQRNACQKLIQEKEHLEIKVQQLTEDLKQQTILCKELQKNPLRKILKNKF